ncbi:hypothetical protein PSQ19_05720 [Devosia algicola]|uniref:Uncharacterized protein n=1 Tax=Devosia algicola TaxID=3026418 RepID=A0ABY7YT74_9HYPH|nr:hypothetical protein [Devosia algicola]WDR04240.1 hypothetical protein PSQ19_05720 [Devosia algicola]
MGLFITSMVVSVGLETVSTQINRVLNPTPPGAAASLTPAGEIWLEQRSGDTRYVLMALGMQPGGAVLNGVTVFNIGAESQKRITADQADLMDGKWVLVNAVGDSPDRPPERLSNYTLPTTSTPAEISLKLSSTEDMTIFEPD